MEMKKRILICVIALCAVVTAGCNIKERTNGMSTVSEPSVPDTASSVEIPASAGIIAETKAGEPAAEQPEEIIDDKGEESAAAAAGDYSDLEGLPDQMVEWGSGGPTDGEGRPNGAIAYQGKYGKYGAYFLAPESDKIYLTFDEGYEYGYTASILDTLKEKDVKAVFFITMHFANSEQDLVRRMIDEGHIVGNHSAAHKPYPTLPVREAAEDMMKLHDYVKETFSYEMSLVRFPEGKFSEQSLGMAQSHGYKSLFWSFAYVDYYIDRQPLTIDALDKITSKAHPGALYLLHAVSRTNSEVLGEAIDIIREQGYEFALWDI